MKQVTQYMIEAMGRLHKAQERVNELKAQGREVEDDFELIINNLLITAATLRQVAMGIVMPTGYGAAVGAELRNTDVAQLPQVEFIQGDTQDTESNQTPLPDYPIKFEAKGLSGKAPVPMLFSYPVMLDRFYAGEYPGAKSEQIARAKIEQMVKFGINVFIDLTEVGELEPYEHILPPGVIHERHPLPDESVPTSHEFTDGVIASIDQHLDSGRIVYIHCWGGIGRTGTMVGCWLATHDYGHPIFDTLETLNRKWSSCPKSKIWPRTPITDEQHRYVLEWEKNNSGG